MNADEGCEAAETAKQDVGGLSLGRAVSCSMAEDRQHYFKSGNISQLRVARFTLALWQSYDLNEIQLTQKMGFVGLKLFDSEHALAYPQPQF